MRSLFSTDSLRKIKPEIDGIQADLHSGNVVFFTHFSCAHVQALDEDERRARAAGADDAVGKRRPVE